jgi:hypothetical protein
MKKFSWIKLVLLIIVGAPVWMWLAWCFTPKRKMVVATVDKTVLTPDGQEHISLIWMLKHKRFTKTSTKLYQISDYFGFFPKDDQKYQVKGLERFSSSQLEQLSKDSDVAFFTDTYGIYRQEWFAGKSQTERSGILYGGMSEQDLTLLKNMKQQKKLVMMEFNDINSPTALNIREEFEHDFGVQWTGWIGRYFDSLDTTVNVELPKWLVRNYIKQRGAWPFKKSGVAFVSEKDQVVVLENETHLANEVPFMVSTDEGQNIYGLPESIKYPYWFDVLKNNPQMNKVMAYHQIYANVQGTKELQRYGIPSKFPAIIIHKGDDYHFSYFAGDFSDNPIGMFSTYFKWIEYIVPWLVHDESVSERKSFFWEVYQPLTSKILEDYYKEKVQSKAEIR